MYLIGQGLASTTIDKRLKFARQFFRAALNHKLITENPFSEVKHRA
jgi:site-specific recombinase XerD